MKLKPLFVTSILSLSLATLAGAAPAVQPSADLAPLFSAASPALCAEAKLPETQPAPTNKAISCGACSDTLCQGKSTGTVCRVQGTRIYKCQLAYVSCDLNDCQCWNGPLP